MVGWFGLRRKLAKLKKLDVDLQVLGEQKQAGPPSRPPLPEQCCAALFSRSKPTDFSVIALYSLNQLRSREEEIVH